MIKPFIKIKAKTKDHLRLWQSKFGGLPYFPKEFQYPTDSNGQAMFLLAQINFSETPKLESFPKKGILQLYVPGWAMFTVHVLKAPPSRMTSEFCTPLKLQKMSINW